MPISGPSIDLKRAALTSAGAFFAFAAFLLLAEAYLRLSPPDDLRPFLGEGGELSGIYRQDPVYGVAYRDADAFRMENAGRLAELAPLFDADHRPPVWAFFGNSFVQAVGMLADTARSRVEDRDVFHLGQNTPLPIRFAQVDLLLQLGLRPERVFLSIMPIDTLEVGRFPLDTWRVTSGGALGYEPHLPPGLGGQLVGLSRSAFALWVRTNNHRGNPNYSSSEVHRAIDARLLEDLLDLFGALADATGRSAVPTTILLIPDERQVVRGAPFGFQDTLKPHLARLGFDVFDPRTDLISVERPGELFIPDGHYSDAGNAILLEALLRHLRFNGEGGEG